MQTCACGCGELVSRIWRPGHHARVTPPRPKVVFDQVPKHRDDVTGCLVWDGYRDKQRGYGRVGRKWAHILAWEAVHGPVPPGLELDHLCRNPSCVEVTHLEPVTHRENVRRGPRAQAQLAKTHCPQGHPYAGDNLIERRGKRECRTCTYERNARARQQRRLQW